jgi:chaperonin GroEL
MSEIGFDVEILEKEEISNVAKKVLEELSKILLNSYGPLGGNTIIHQNGAPPIVTKDGWNILKGIRFNNYAELDVYQLIQTISGNLVDKVGDGSTSAIIVANQLYSSLLNIYNNTHPLKFKELLIDLQKVISVIIEERITKKIDSQENKLSILTKIASISNNNNAEIGSKVAELFNLLNSESIVNIELSPYTGGALISYNLKEGFNTRDCKLPHSFYFSGKGQKDGMRLGRSYIVNSFLLDPNLYDATVKTLSVEPAHIIFIAESVEPTVKTAILKSGMEALNSNKLPKVILLEVSDLSNERNINALLDLDSYVDSSFNSLSNISLEDLSDSSKLKSLFGEANEVLLSPTGEVSFIGGAGYLSNSEDYNSRLSTLRKDYANTPLLHKIKRGELRVRINKLSGTNANLFVGGRTEDEKKNLKFLVEDSVLACQSVLRNGYTLGSNYAALYAAKEFIEMLEDDSCTDVDKEDRLAVAYHEFITKYLYGKPTNTDDSVLILEILGAIVSAYTKVQTTVINFNKLEVPSFLNNLSNAAFDISTDMALFNIKTGNIEYFATDTEENPDVLCAVSTDLEILSASFSIVELLLSSNQYIKY